MMAAIDRSSQIITREWLNGISIERLQPSSGQENWADLGFAGIERSEPSSGHENWANLDFAEELYRTILDVFKDFWQSSSTAPNKRQVKEILARLRLWGRELGDGKLAVVLGQSDELRDTTLHLLRRAGRTVARMLFETLP